jgi:hypothetical protein
MTARNRTDGNDSADEVEYGPPLKPRPVLLVVLSIVLALWLVALIAMRLRTVHPEPVLHTEPAPTLSR